MTVWCRLAGSLYALRNGDDVWLREWDSPRAPVWRGSELLVLAAIAYADDNVTFGGRQGDDISVTVQRADLADLAAWIGGGA